MMKHYFPDPPPFRHYDPKRVVGGKTMAEHLRFAMCYWHTMRGTGADPFGMPTMQREWERASDPMQRARDTMDAAFELMGRLKIGFWCFHDRDIAPEGSALAQTATNLETMVAYAATKQNETGVRLLWGTASLFAHPRYMSGAATNPDPHVFAWAATQVKHALEATHALGGAGYVFWGGREGYETLLNTDMQREREQYARFLTMAAEHAKAIGFKGQLYIEPKPKEPTVHQYDSDVEACLNFLREFGLMGTLKLNIETNHATLAGHTMVHELRVARLAGALGSIDANVGDELLGWDTDQFATDVRLTTGIMLEVLRMGGFTTGGLNFDAKVRRQSTDATDLMHAHVGSMDAFALGLIVSDTLLRSGELDRFVAGRYAGWSGELGRKILSGAASLAECEAYIAKHGEPQLRSGRQEMLENIVARAIAEVE
ncbi:MAG TPA: xylose isomerase [Gemmatimonadaceae bacterium]|nr:xylose isomerase [Gemmatimonadaceae bacterium]